MAENDLNQPLRRRHALKGQAPRSLIVTGTVAAAAAVALFAGMWIAVVDDPLGGRPVAVAAIRDAAPAATGSLTEGPLQGRGTSSGRVAALPNPGRFEVASRPGGPVDDVAASGQVGEAVGLAAAGAAPAVRGAPRIVLVVGGMGISQTGTQEAIKALPENVTLAFAPYGGSLQRWVDRARREGHEILLQVPLEPFGYPETDPGAHTLLASAEPAVNEENLRWLLGRITSYAGVMNYMGARFTSDPEALAPFLVRLSEHGLFYLDDGSAPQSLARQLGAETGASVLTADEVIDLDRRREEIDRKLEDLEAIATAHGLAVGVASAFPASVAAIAEWIPAARERGIAVVPASAALSR